MQKLFQNFFRSKTYKLGIILIIVFNSITLGFATSSEFSEKFSSFFYYVDMICLWIFIVESILKLYAFRLSFFTSSEKGWNIYDLFIVIISAYISYDFVVLRAFRVFRVLRLLRVMPSMRFVCSTMLFAVPQIISIVMLLLLFYYIYGVLCCNLFAANMSEHFGTLEDCFFTLFTIMTLDGGSAIVKEAMGVYPYAWVIFVSFILICTFIIMNLIIAIIVNSIDEIKKKNEENNSKDMI